MSKDLKRASKFLSLLLRHKPEELSLSLDANGWVEIRQLIENSQSGSIEYSFELIFELVKTSDKQRFELNAEKTKVRARQGHSIDVDLNLEPTQAPEHLYHGTAKRFLSNILREGLTKQSRHHVHLSPDEETARKVGSRHGKPVILTVLSKNMEEKGFVFYRTDNNVWLTDHVPPEFLLTDDTTSERD